MLKYRPLFGNESEFECLPCFSEDGILHARDPEKNPEFVYMYTTLFKHLDIRLPFIEFEMSVLVQIDVAQTQFHPNSWPFLWSFEVLMEFLRTEPSLQMSSLPFSRPRGFGKDTGVSEQHPNNGNFVLYLSSYMELKDNY